jgi:hypothetical protein
MIPVISNDDIVLSLRFEISEKAALGIQKKASAISVKSLLLTLPP